MSINTFFDHIYCLNLDRRTDRWERSQEVFAKFNIQDVERFSATDGALMASHGNVNPGQAGIIDSHIRMLKDALANGYENILILEDDVEFVDNAEEIFACVETELFNGGPFNMLYLGGNLELWNQPRVTDHLWLAGGVLSTHAFAISSHMFASLLQIITYRRAIDLTYMASNGGPNSYIIRPRIAYQRKDFSDINGHYTNYDHLLRES